MKRMLVLLAVAATAFSARAESIAEELTGDEKLACEAVLCLSSGQRPSECAPSLRRYFDITKSTWDRTVDAREDFLNKCPASSSDNNMRQLVSAISRGAGRCDAAGLNTTLRTFVYDYHTESSKLVIGNAMPGFCNIYVNHAYTDFSGMLPMYVGIPERGGYWVEPAMYDHALAEYNARIAEEDRLACIHAGGWAGFCG
jgi:hypothetical protein